MDRRIEKAFDIIKRRYQSKLLLKDLASKVGLSPFYFQRLFKKEMNETPSECLTRIRLERSGHLIKAGTKMSLSDIAADCGFSSLSTFSRVFSQKFGISPSRFSIDRDTSIETIHLKKSEKELVVEILYFPDRYIFYNPTSIQNRKLLDECVNARSFCETKGIKTTDNRIGISTHITFHYPNEKLNYYAGVEILSSASSVYSDRIFFAPKGKYACYYTSDSCLDVRETGMRFHLEWIMKSKKYLRRDLFAIEEYLPEDKNSDYPYLKRRICIPIKSIGK
jgi:AraC-like DNA-binding protein